ncbi:MAG: polyprenyl synthetase family protein [Planctomycetota bacterium]|jgi:geranylgeranyl pyrophosphate synthase
MRSAASEPVSGILTESAVAIDAALRDRIDALDAPEPLRAAVRYALLDGGKRLRPALVLLACEAAGGQRSDALPAAVAIEMVHAFSLVHDDLPAMDDAALRRGRPSLHVHAGEAMAILVGDLLLAAALRCVIECPVDAHARNDLLAELSRATEAMIAGQVLDTLGGLPEQLDPVERLRYLHGLKTGALLRAACRLGARCAAADEDTLNALTDYGESVGLMFQVVDDVLDVTGSTEHLGKTAGTDDAAGKLTYPAVLGLEASRSEIERLRLAARAALEPLGAAASRLATLCDDMAVRTR